MKKVVISSRVSNFDHIEEKRDSVDQRLCSWVTFLGYLPIILPNILVRNKNYKFLSKWLSAIGPHAFVLSGGEDFGLEENRDLTETYIIEYAQKKKIPMLAICRGMQMLGIYNGVELFKAEGHVNIRHNVKGILNAEVNSYHSYALQKCPTDFIVTEYSNDELIEGIKHKTLPIEGCMWHPEREIRPCRGYAARIRTLFG